MPHCTECSCPCSASAGGIQSRGVTASGPYCQAIGGLLKKAVSAPVTRVEGATLPICPFSDQRRPGCCSEGRQAALGGNNGAEQADKCEICRPGRHEHLHQEIRSKDKAVACLTKDSEADGLQARFRTWHRLKSANRLPLAIEGSLSPTASPHATPISAPLDHAASPGFRPGLDCPASGNSPALATCPCVWASCAGKDKGRMQGESAAICVTSRPAADS